MARFALAYLTALLVAVSSVRLSEDTLDIEHLEAEEVEQAENLAEDNGGLAEDDPDSSYDEASHKKRSFADIFLGRNMRLNVAEEKANIADFVLNANEEIICAFGTFSITGSRKVKTFFTTDRILVRKADMFPGTQYTSLSYGVVKAWSLRSSGSGLIQDTALKIWTSVQSSDVSTLQVTFRNTSKDDDKMLLDVNQVMTKMVLGENIPDRDFDQFGKKWEWTNLLWFWRVGLHSKELNQAEVETKLRANVPILGDTEEVRHAFQRGRDYEVYTSKRLILIDTKWYTGRVVEYRSIPWAEASVWGVKTAEVVDVDSDLHIYTSIPELPHAKIAVKPDFKMEQKIMRITSQQIMQAPVDENMPPATRFARANRFFSLAPKLSDGANFKTYFSEEVPGLMNMNEEVQMAVKDILVSSVLTDQRWISVRRAGYRAVEFQSVPWRESRAFTLRYDNGFWVKNAELRLYTGVRGKEVCGRRTNVEEVDAIGDSAADEVDDIIDEIPGSEYKGYKVRGNKDCKTIPGMGLLKQRFLAFAKRGFKPDMVYMNRMISEKILGKVDDSQPSVAGQPNPAGAMFSKDLQTWLEGKAGEISAAEAQGVLDAQNFLLPGEQVTYCLRLWRNTMVTTPKRLIAFQRFGLFGRIMEYSSFPWRSVVAFQSRSAGLLRIGGEVRLWMSIPSLPTQRFRISLINRLDKVPGAATAIARHVLLTPRNGYSSADQSLLQISGPSAPIHWLFGNFGNTNKEEAEARIRKDAPLLPEESIISAFKNGRDMIVLTTLRILRVDVQWFTGKQVEYRSIPYAQCRMWSVDVGSVWHVLTIWTDMHPNAIKNGGIMSKITAKFQAATIDAAKIDNFLRDKILLLNAKPNVSSLA